MKLSAARYHFANEQQMKTNTGKFRLPSSPEKLRPGRFCYSSKEVAEGSFIEGGKLYFRSRALKMAPSTTIEVKMSLIVLFFSFSNEFQVFYCKKVDKEPRKRWRQEQLLLLRYQKSNVRTIIHANQPMVSKLPTQMSAPIYPYARPLVHAL